MKRFWNRWNCWLGMLAAVICCFFFLGSGLEAPAAMGLSLESSQEASENPFGEGMDMRVYWEALEIVGDTALDDLSDAQKVQLVALGIPEDQLPEFLENLESYLTAQEDGTVQESQPGTEKELIFLGVCAVLPLLLLGTAIFLLIWFSRRGRSPRKKR